MFLLKFALCDFNDAVMHFSFDDYSIRNVMAACFGCGTSASLDGQGKPCPYGVEINGMQGAASPTHL